MDLDRLKLLDPEQKERYMRLERLFEQPGWQDVLKWALVNKVSALGRELNALNWETNREYHGARLAFEMVQGLQDSTELEFEAMASDALTDTSDEIALEHE